MSQLKDRRGHPDVPPAMASDGKGGYREALLQSWGEVPEYRGRGRAPTVKCPQPEWQYLQVIKNRCGSRLRRVSITRLSMAKQMRLLAAWAHIQPTWSVPT